MAKKTAKYYVYKETSKGTLWYCYQDRRYWELSHYRSIDNLTHENPDVIVTAINNQLDLAVQISLGLIPAWVDSVCRITVNSQDRYYLVAIDTGIVVI